MFPKNSVVYCMDERQRLLKNHYFRNKRKKTIAFEL